jgi:hypothetical protein
VVVAQPLPAPPPQEGPLVLPPTPALPPTNRPTPRKKPRRNVILTPSSRSSRCSRRTTKLRLLSRRAWAAMPPSSPSLSSMFSPGKLGSRRRL